MSTIRPSMMAEPFLLSPAGKDYLWGGERLKYEYGKSLSLSPLAETWECSCHPDGESLVRSGAEAGKTLSAVLAAHPAYLGTHPLPGRFPVLVKLIDAARDLSVQVHPDDAFALAHEGQPGKHEMWYVLDAVPGARLAYGFNRNMTAQRIRRGVADGSIMEDLQFLPVQRGDVFFIPPGMVHAVGAGVLLAEVQQSSNVTYRLYDYDRRDQTGQLRPLHLEKALRVLRMERTPPVRRALREQRFQPGSSSELLCRCRYFQVEKLHIRTAYRMRTAHNSFQILLCTAGSGTLVSRALLPLRAGDCVFIPADCGTMTLEGQLEALKITC